MQRALITGITGQDGRYLSEFLAGKGYQVFGLVHGAGFANYLRSLFVDRIAVPLFGFNVGIELGQLVVLAMAAVVFVVVDATIAWLKPRNASVSPVRLRTVAVSMVVLVVATRWAIERAPW